MKRIIAFLLALTMIFALCACGNSEVKSTPEPTSEPTLETIPELSEEYFKIIDVKLKPYKDGKYWPNVKFQCLYPKDKHEKYPMVIDLYISVLDEEGVVIQKEEIKIMDPTFEEIGWSCVYDNGLRLLIDPNEGKTIKLTGYRFGFYGIPQELYDFDEPLVFQVTDLEVEQ